MESLGQLLVALVALCGVAILFFMTVFMFVMLFVERHSFYGNKTEWEMACQAVRKWLGLEPR